MSDTYHLTVLLALPEGRTFQPQLAARDHYAHDLPSLLQRAEPMAWLMAPHVSALPHCREHFGEPVPLQRVHRWVLDTLDEVIYSLVRDDIKARDMYDVGGPQWQLRTAAMALDQRPAPATMWPMQDLAVMVTIAKPAPPITINWAPMVAMPWQSR